MAFGNLLGHAGWFDAAPAPTGGVSRWTVVLLLSAVFLERLGCVHARRDGVRMWKKLELSAWRRRLAGRDQAIHWVTWQRADDGHRDTVVGDLRVLPTPSTPHDRRQVVA